MRGKVRTGPSVAVIGGGHAGIEAACASARMGARAVMITLDRSRIGELSCNPAVGGVAKGTLVREIDALGGVMGELADASAVQFRMLNSSRGPAVRGPRVQCDAVSYRENARRALAEAGVEVVEAEAVSLETRSGRIEAVETADGRRIVCEALVLAAGTFLGGRLFRGRERWRGGRAGDLSSDRLLECLEGLGFHVERFKTGTPPRLLASSLDSDGMDLQAEDGPGWLFSTRSRGEAGARVACHALKAGPGSIDAARRNLGESPLFGGAIAGRGPRYCPSFEDKAVRFPGREEHPVFIEPMGRGARTVYVSGMSTSLPRPAQEEMIRALPGCSRAVVVSWGYAVEYAWIPGEEYDGCLRCRTMPNLLLAGQICGTSGYEEAAALGIIAGRNAAASALGVEPLALRREESFAGVMIDDLARGGLTEPYRLFSSRAENRLHIRQDNAALRMMPVAVSAGIARPGDAERIAAMEEEYGRARRMLTGIRTGGRSLAELCRRPGFDVDSLASMDGLAGFDRQVLGTAALDERYGGYVARARRRLAEIDRMSGVSLEGIASFMTLESVSIEAREGLELARPATLAEAARLPFVRPPDLDALLVHASRAVPRGTSA